MSTPMYSNIIISLSDEIDVLTKTFLFDGYQTLADFLKVPLGGLCVLYITLLGYGVARGLIKTPMEELVKSAFRIGVIYMLAMNWSVFSAFIVNFFTHGVGELGAAMFDLLPTNIPNSSEAVGINGGLQSVLTEVVRVGSWIWDEASIRHIGFYYIAGIVYLSGIAVVGIAFFELTVAKLMISVCLCTAPLFLTFTLFDKTRSYFDQWLGKLIGFSFVIFFVSTVAGFCLHLIDWVISPHFAAHGANFLSTDWIPLVMCAAFGVMALLEVVGMAKSIGGSCSTGSGSAMMGGLVGGLLGSGAAQGATQTIGRAARALGKAVVPGGAIAAGAGALATKAASMRGAGMKAIQQRLRGKKQ